MVPNHALQNITKTLHMLIDHFSYMFINIVFLSNYGYKMHWLFASFSSFAIYVKTNPSVVIHNDDNDYFKLSLIVPNVSFSISGNNKTLLSMFYFTTLFLFFFDKQYNDNFFSCLTVMVCKHYFRFVKGSNSLIFIRLAVLQSLLYV